MRVIISNLFTFVSDKLINLNLFPARTFSSHSDRVIMKRLGQWSTRLYIFLLIFILIILFLYTVIQARVLTKTFPNPSFDLYNDLINNYNDTLQCPCSLISSTYSHS